MNYQYIVKQESSAGDSQFILQKMNLDKLTYLPGQYNNSLGIIFKSNTTSSAKESSDGIHIPELPSCVFFQ